MPEISEEECQARTMGRACLYCGHYFGPGERRIPVRIGAMKECMDCYVVTKEAERWAEKAENAWLEAYGYVGGQE